MRVGDRQAQRGRRPGAATPWSTSRGLPAPGSPDEAGACAARVRVDGVRARGDADRRLPRAARARRRDRRGAVDGAEVRSPSVQLRVTPLGEVELLSTHDQVLGGPSGQSYLGCRFPADFGYAQRDHARGGEDRAAARRGGRPRPVRRSTSSSSATRRRAGRRTRSRSTCARAARRTRSSRCSSSPTGATTRRRRCSPRRAGARSTSSRPTTSSPTCCAALTTDDLFDIVARHGLHFDQARQAGVVFHMISALTELGRVGLTAVGDSPAAGRCAVPPGRADPARGGRAGAGAAAAGGVTAAGGLGRAGLSAGPLRSPAPTDRPGGAP